MCSHTRSLIFQLPLGYSVELLIYLSFYYYYYYYYHYYYDYYDYYYYYWFDIFHFNLDDTIYFDPCKKARKKSNSYLLK